MSLSTLEVQIKTEWNVVRAWIATHQTISLAGVGVILWVLGRLHLPI